MKQHSSEASLSNDAKAAAALSDSDRAGLYRAIFTRRDVRSQFLNDPIPVDILARMLTAAHHAPSVGFMQPWNFIVIQSKDRRKEIHGLFEKANKEAAEKFDGDRRDHYQSLKLAGILDTPLNICITCNHDRAGDVVLGRTHMPETDLYSTVCAVQNLWLAARAEGVGIGWVSIIDPNALAKTLSLPDHVTPVAYLCLGYVSEFLNQPELEKAGWDKRLNMDDILMLDGWQGDMTDHPLAEQVQKIQSQFPSEIRDKAENT